MEYQVVDMLKREMEANSPLRDRKIYLNEEIDRESIFKVMYWLDRLADIDKKTGKKFPITICIDSYGGDADITLAICSKIKSMINNGYEIITQINSMAYSGGFWIFICGSKRIALANSHLLIHSMMLSNISGTYQEVINILKEIDRSWVRLKNIIIENTNITEEKIESIKDGSVEWFLYADECVEQNLGIVDEIV